MEYIKQYMINESKAVKYDDDYPLDFEVKEDIYVLFYKFSLLLIKIDPKNGNKIKRLSDWRDMSLDEINEKLKNKNNPWKKDDFR